MVDKAGKNNRKKQEVEKKEEDKYLNKESEPENKPVTQPNTPFCPYSSL